MENNNYNPYQNNSNDSYNGYSNNATFKSYADRTEDGYSSVGYTTTETVVDTESSNKVIAMSFIYMVAALAISGIVAIFAYATDIAYNMIFNGTYYALIFIELAVVIAADVAIAKNKDALARIFYFAYSICTGLTFSVFFYAYTEGSIAIIFFATAIMFAVIAAVAMNTKKDLTALGVIGYMGLVALILATIIMAIAGIDSAVIAVIGLALFIGITAYDIQKIKRLANANIGWSTHTLALFGALNIYLDFINIFLKLIRLFGKRR